MKFEKIKYSELNSKAKEMYNFQKASAKFADYGFTTMWLNNDWQGADFIAVHADGITDIKVQLKGRLSFSKKYVGKNIYINMEEGDKVIFLKGSALGACASAEILNLRTKKVCKVWCE